MLNLFKQKDMKYVLWNIVFGDIVGYVSKLKFGYMWELYMPYSKLAFKKGWKASFSSAVIKCHSVKEKLPAQIKIWEVLE
jgi:hypothetical protein